MEYSSDVVDITERPMNRQPHFSNGLLVAVVLAVVVVLLYRVQNHAYDDYDELAVPMKTVFQLVDNHRVALLVLVSVHEVDSMMMKIVGIHFEP